MDSLGEKERKDFLIQFVQRDLEMVLNLARNYGLVVTVYQKPLEPLSMRNYETVYEIREAR